MADEEDDFFQAAISLRIWPIQAQLQSLPKQEPMREVSPTTILSDTDAPATPRPWGVYCQCTLYSMHNQLASRYRAHTQSALPDLTWELPGQDSLIDFPLSQEMEELEILCYSAPANHKPLSRRHKSQRHPIGKVKLFPDKIRDFEYQAIQTLPLYSTDKQSHQTEEEFVGELTLRIEFAMRSSYLLSVLPDEILYHIFSFLTWEALSQVRLVCRRWNYLSHDTGLVLSMARRSTRSRSYLEATRFYRWAVKAGDTTSMVELGRLYQHKLATTVTTQEAKETMYKQAFHWYYHSVEAGEKGALNDLGWCYEKGLGCEEDLGKAVHYYREAAEYGDISGQNNTGWCYQKGIGVTQDYQEALRWYKCAADRGNSSGYNNMAWCYHQGMGVEQNYKKAAEFYLKAAALGNRFAQNTIGNMYYYGQGVPKCLDDAIYWVGKAAQQGHGTATKALIALKEERDQNLAESRNTTD